jgi:hypothetical protein
MGEVADRVGDFVTAYSGDLKSDETLDGQRLVIGGIVVASRTVVTRARSTMAVVTLEDLQGSIEVVVFPKLYEQTGPTWAEGAILLVAGRVDHRGEDVSLLADLVVPWDEAIVRGTEAFAREVSAGDRGSFRRRGPAGAAGTGAGPGEQNGFGNGGGDRNGYAPGTAVVVASGAGGTTQARPAGAAVGPGRPVASGAPGAPAGSAMPARRADVPYVSPLRADAAVAASLPPIAPAEPVPTYAPAPAGASGRALERDDEPALPDEARMRAVAEAGAATAPLEPSGTGRVLHVRFGGAPPDQLIIAMERFRQLVRERPGETRVVVHVPAPGGTALPMELKQAVAYDAELLAEVERRLGDGVAQVSLA